MGVCVCVCVCVLVAQSCPILCDPMDCSPPSSSVHETFQAGILEWVAMPCPRDLPVLYNAGSSNPALCDSLEEWAGVGGGREVQEGGDVRIPTADSRWCVAETDKIL